MLLAGLHFFDAHPWAWLPFALVVWYVGTGLLLSLIDRTLPHTDDAWALWFAEAPWKAAAASLVKSWGWDLPKGVRAIRSLLRGPPPAALLAGPPRTSEDLRRIAIASVYPPPRPPMASGDSFDAVPATHPQPERDDAEQAQDRQDQRRGARDPLG